jgi:hypothetical protein
MVTQSPPQINKKEKKRKKEEERVWKGIMKRGEYLEILKLVLITEKTYLENT